jgi:hypothetical protein
MKGVEKKYILGIVTDEDAMFELLSKFLNKEGYEVKRVLHEVGEVEDFDLIVHAPSRYSDRSKRLFKDLKGRKLLVVQSVDKDFSEDEDGVIVLSERPLNLKQLGETIKNALAKPDCIETVR